MKSMLWDTSKVQQHFQVVNTWGFLVLNSRLSWYRERRKAALKQIKTGLGHKVYKSQTKEYNNNKKKKNPKKVAKWYKSKNDIK